MSTVNFSVPEEVKEAFNRTFEGRNKSAVIADLMREAVLRDARQRESEAAFARILKRRASAPKASDADIRRVRVRGRP
ncbi:MAG: hypothetical protein JNM79_20820 [Burkholderiales bacterium]|nr:hypothetical protein [Burkholderiales bacterium]